MKERLPDCGLCGGRVAYRTGLGRTHEYLPGVVLAVPNDFAIATCQKCGERYLTSAESEALEARLVGPYAEYCRELVQAVRARTGVTLREVELASGVTATYLSHVLAGRKQPSLMLVRLLQAFARHPEELRRHQAGGDWRSRVRLAVTNHRTRAVSRRA
jgi:hypothetical protein